jgi:hypothetical protein
MRSPIRLPKSIKLTVRSTVRSTARVDSEVNCEVDDEVDGEVNCEVDGEINYKVPCKGYRPPQSRQRGRRWPSWVRLCCGVGPNTSTGAVLKVLPHPFPYIKICGKLHILCEKGEEIRRGRSQRQAVPQGTLQIKCTPWVSMRHILQGNCGTI